MVRNTCQPVSARSRHLLPLVELLAHALLTCAIRSSSIGSAGADLTDSGPLPPSNGTLVDLAH